MSAKNSDDQKTIKAAAKAKSEKGGSKKNAPTFSFEIEKGKPKSLSHSPRLKKLYQEKIIPLLIKELNLKNKMEVPRLKKIVINTSLKEALVNPKILESALDDLALLTGQKPVVTKAKKSIASFKLREGQPIGAMVTLRKARMYEFLDRLINVALPRVRDFKGINSKSFDGRGNYSMGLKEQIIFPEINYDRIDKVRGMNITIETSAKNNDHARMLLSELGMPFKK